METKAPLWADEDGVSAFLDHRGLLKVGETYYIIGGLDDDLNVRADITQFHLQTH